MKKVKDEIVVKKGKLQFHPVDKSRWKDFEKLFGERGACGGCWCMAWRLTRADFGKGKGDGNKKAIRKIINSDNSPGLLAYYDGAPIGWCAVAPREEYIRLESSKVLKPVDDKHVWSISCFFIDKNFRRQGISVALINAAVKFCKSKKAKIVEAYPVEPYNENIPAAFAWTGFPSAFEKAGFEVAARRSKTRPVMRYYL